MIAIDRVDPLIAKECMNPRTGKHVSYVLDKRGRVYVCNHAGTHVGILQNQPCKVWWPKVVAHSAIRGPVCPFGVIHKIILWCANNGDALEHANMLQLVTDQTPLQEDRVCYMYARDMNRLGVVVCESAECLSLRDLDGMRDVLSTMAALLAEVE